MKRPFFRTGLAVLVLGTLLSCRKEHVGIDDADLSEPWSVALTAECTTLEANGDEAFRLEIAGVGTATIDWGDGSAPATVDMPRIQQTETGHAFGKRLAHTYPTTGRFSVSLSGRTGSLDLLYCDGPADRSIDLAEGNRYASLELTHCAQLEYLHCQTNRLTELELGQCARLVQLWCGANRIATLSLGRHARLESIRCESNRLTAIDIRGCEQLHTLDCRENALTTEAMNRIYRDLPTVSPSSAPIQGAVVSTDPEIAGDYSIAAKKGWYVDFMPSVPFAD